MSMNFFDTDEQFRGFDWEVTKRLGGYLKPYRRNLMISLSGMLFTVLANIVGPPIIGYAVDEGIRKRDMSIVVMGVVGYIIIQGLGLFGFNMQLRAMAIAGQHIIQTLRDEL